MFAGLLALFGFVVSACHTQGHDVSSFDAWFNQLNDDLRVIYQYTAHFAWELRYENEEEKKRGNSIRIPIHNALHFISKLV